MTAQEVWADILEAADEGVLDMSHYAPQRIQEFADSECRPFREAIGLLTTMKPTMIMGPEGMVEEVIAYLRSKE